MRTSGLVAAALVAMTSVWLAGQQAEGNAGGNGGQQNAQLSAAVYAQMRPVNAELQGSLDAKHAKVGDAVVLKTTEKMTTADGTAIPRGTRLVGHVTLVQAHGKDSPDSAIAMVIDRAELKGGGSVGIYTEVRAVSAPVLAAPLDSAGSTDEPGGNSVGGGRSGSGLRMGSGVGGVGGVANTGNHSVNGQGTSANDSVRASNAALEAVAGTGEAGTGGTHGTTIPGLMLTGDATGRTSGTLTARRENVHLESGTQGAGCGR